MESLLAACGAALLALVLTLTIRKDSPAIAFLLALGAGLVVLYRTLAAVGGAVQSFSQLFTQGGMGESLYLPVIKVVGIAVVVRIMSALCKDGGQGALAAKLELAGAVLAIVACLPLLTQVLSLLGDWAF